MSVPDSAGFFFIHMKYSFKINQKAVIDNGFKLDVIECCLLNFMYDFIATGLMAEKVYKDERYFYFSHQYVIKEVPILGINTKEGLRKRLANLEKKGFLKRHPDNQITGKAFYRLTPKITALLFSDLPTNVGTPPNGSLDVPPNNRLDNHIIKDSPIKDKKGKKDTAAAQPPSLPPDFSISEIFIHDTVLRLMCSTDKTHSKYLEKCLRTYREDQTTEAVKTNLIHFSDYVKISGQFVSTDVGKVVKQLNSTDWKAKLQRLDHGPDAVQMQIDISSKTGTERSYWDQVKAKSEGRTSA